MPSIATMIVSPALAYRIRQETAPAELIGISAVFTMRIIEEPRLPSNVYFTSGRVLVHGTPEYEQLLADALASE